MTDEEEQESENPEAEKGHLEQTLEQMSASDELDRSFIVIDPHLWIAHYTIIFFTLILLLWAFFGSIPIKIQGKGIFIDRQGLFSAHSKTAGIVQKLMVKQGSLIKKGDVIAEVVDPENELKLKLANARIVTMQNDLERLKKEIELEGAKQRESILSKIKAAEFGIGRTEEEIENLNKDLTLRKGLVKEGLLAPTNLRETEKELSGKENSLETQKSNLITLNSDLEKGYRTEEYKIKEEGLLKDKQEIDLLQLTKDFAKVQSPFDGYIIEVLVNQGDRVSTGSPLVILEHRKDLEAQPSLLVFGFVPVDLGKRIKVGLKVQMEISTVRAEEFGKMLGTISEISEFAVSPEHLAKLIPNQALVNYLMQDNKAVIQLEIEPELDPSTPSGYKWTTITGSPIPITSGTVCTIETIVEKIRPFYFIFPIDQLRNVLYLQKTDQKKILPNIEDSKPLKDSSSDKEQHHG